MEHTQNCITLCGQLQQLPQFSHENHGRRFFRFTLEVPRLSGTVDLLPIVAPESVLQDLDPTAGSQLRVTGQIRSHNQRTDGARHLLIFVYAATVESCEGDSSNEVFLEGPLCKEPVIRSTPLGRQICDVMLAVKRPFHRADYLPCILWGRTAQTIAQCHVSDEIQIVGRLQSRLYTKQTPEGPEQRTAYEISALTAQVLPQENP